MSKSKYARRKVVLEERRSKLIQSKGARCTMCHRKYPDYVFDLHHTNPSDKSFSISGSNLLRSWYSILKEAEKCELLCSNCHRIKHNNLRIYSRFNNSITLRGK